MQILAPHVILLQTLTSLVFISNHSSAPCTRKPRAAQQLQTFERPQIPCDLVVEEKIQVLQWPEACLGTLEPAPTRCQRQLKHFFRAHATRTCGSAWSFGFVGLQFFQARAARTNVQLSSSKPESELKAPVIKWLPWKSKCCNDLKCVLESLKLPKLGMLESDTNSNWKLARLWLCWFAYQTTSKPLQPEPTCSPAASNLRENSKSPVICILFQRKSRYCNNLRGVWHKLETATVPSQHPHAVLPEVFALVCVPTKFFHAVAAGTHLQLSIFKSESELKSPVILLLQRNSRCRNDLKDFRQSLQLPQLRVKANSNWNLAIQTQSPNTAACQAASLRQILPKNL